MNLTRYKGLSKSDLSLLIDQLEAEMTIVLKNKDTEKAEKLNILIGNVIDLYNSK